MCIFFVYFILVALVSVSLRKTQSWSQIELNSSIFAFVKVTLMFRSGLFWLRFSSVYVWFPRQKYVFSHCYANDTKFNLPLRWKIVPVFLTLIGGSLDLNSKRLRVSYAAKWETVSVCIIFSLNYVTQTLVSLFALQNMEKLKRSDTSGTWCVPPIITTWKQLKEWK